MSLTIAPDQRTESANTFELSMLLSLDPIYRRLAPHG